VTFNVTQGYWYCVIP